MTDRGNQLSLGVFVATFVYGLMVLRVVRAEDEVPATAADAAATYLPGFVPQISLLIAVALLLLSVAVLVYFLHHIPASIRINSVLRSEEPTSELQSLMRISYAVFCFKK